MKIILYNQDTFDPLLAFYASMDMVDCLLGGTTAPYLRVPYRFPMLSGRLDMTTAAMPVKAQTFNVATIEFVLVPKQRGVFAMLNGRIVPSLSKRDLFEIKHALTNACGGHSQRDEEDLSLI